MKLVMKNRCYMAQLNYINQPMHFMDVGIFPYPKYRKVYFESEE